MLTTLTFRLYPSLTQVVSLEHYLSVGRQIFNDALEQRKRHYAETGKLLSLYTQFADLTIMRSVSGVLAMVPVLVARDALSRVDLAFRHFFRRLNGSSGKAGFPRFKSWKRWNSFSISSPGKTVVRGNRIRVSGLETTIRARNVQPFAGTVKQQRIIRRAGRWHCQLVVDDCQPTLPLVPVRSAVGIDVGLKSFAALSNGESVDNPRFARDAARKVASANRSVSRKSKGSRSRHKAILRLQLTHARVAGLRSNFAHQLSRRLVNEHQFIAIEDLNINGMVHGRLANGIMDAAWGQFARNLTYKAANAGGQVIRVNPSGTSQDCSSCGHKVAKSLTVRIHRCPSCGLVLNRDHNAALNILQRALKLAPGPGRGIGKACGAATKPL